MRQKVEYMYIWIESQTYDVVLIKIIDEPVN